MISGEVLIGVIPLALSLVLNAFQWYRQRIYSRTVYNGIVGTFNSIGLLLARCMNKTKEINDKLGKLGDSGDDATMREFRDFSLDTEWSLRQLHEQLVAVAKTVSERDKRWQAGEFGYTKEEIEKIRGLFTEGGQGARS